MAASEKSQCRKVRLAFWEKWLSRDSPFSKNREQRLQPDREIPSWAIEALPDTGERIRILDVNPGPISSLGNMADGEEVELVPIDPLADAYQKIILANGLQPPVPTRFCAPEDVFNTFGKEAFHLIYSYNGLDYTSDPTRIYKALLKSLNPNGRIITFHEAAKDKKQLHREGFRFFHACENNRAQIEKKRYPR